MRRDEHRENDAGHRAHHRRLRGVPRKVSEVRNGETQARRRRDAGETIGRMTQTRFFRLLSCLCNDYHWYNFSD